MREKKVCVIIPAYNEALNIVRVVNELQQKCPAYDYVVINDGSTDTTKEICEENGINYINLPHNLGIGGAVQAGYKYAMHYDYDIAVQLDGDGQHDASYLSEGIALLDNGYDMVLGSRFVEKTDGFQSSFARRVGINFLSHCIFAFSGKRIYDVTSGFRICNREMIKYFVENYDQEYPEPQAILSAVLDGFQVKEYPVNMCDRIQGTSSIKNWKAFRYMILVSLSLFLTWKTKKMGRT